MDLSHLLKETEIKQIRFTGYEPVHVQLKEPKERKSTTGDGIVAAAYKNKLYYTRLVL